MNAYRPNIPRVGLGLAAAALTVTTIGLSVIAPARMDFRSQQVPVIALSEPSSQVIANVAGAAPIVDTIDVRASRGSRLVTVVESHRVQQDRLRG